MYTLLETINYVISQVGASPVTDVNDTLPDVASSKLRIGEAMVNTLKRGWWFNTDYNQEIETDANDKIPLGADVIKVIRATPYFLTVRGGFAYDPYNQTDTFPDISSVCVDVVRMLDYENLPPVVQEVVRFAAAREHVMIELEDDKKVMLIDQLHRDAFVEMKKDDLQIKQRNMAYTPKFLRTRSGVRPYRMGRGVNPYRPGG